MLIIKFKINPNLPRIALAKFDLLKLRFPFFPKYENCIDNSSFSNGAKHLLMNSVKLAPPIFEKYLTYKKGKMMCHKVSCKMFKDGSFNLLNCFCNLCAIFKDFTYN